MYQTFYGARFKHLAIEKKCLITYSPTTDPFALNLEGGRRRQATRGIIETRSTFIWKKHL